MAAAQLLAFTLGGLGLRREAGRAAGVERRGSPNPLTVAEAWSCHAVSSPGLLYTQASALCQRPEDTAGVTFLPVIRLLM